MELFADYPENSNMEMEGIMKRPNTKLLNATNADKWKTKVLNMCHDLEKFQGTKFFISINRNCNS